MTRSSSLQKVDVLFEGYTSKVIKILEKTGYYFLIKLIEPEVRFVHLTEGIKELTGYSVEEHYNNPDIMIDNLLPSYREEMENIYNRSTIQDPITTILKWKTKSGDIIEIKYFLSKLKIDGKLLITCAFRDITDEISIQLLKEENMKHLRACSYCSNLYDSRDWVEIDKFVKNILNKEVTHGICESCKYIMLNVQPEKKSQNEFDTNNIDLKKEKIIHQTTKSKLHLANARYRVIFENSPIGMVGQLDGKIVICNPTFARILNYDNPEEVIGLKIDEIIANNEVDKIKNRALRRQDGHDEPDEYYTSFVTKDGDKVEAYVKIAFLEFPELGKVPFASVMIDNINSKPDITDD